MQQKKTRKTTWDRRLRLDPPSRGGAARPFLPEHLGGVPLLRRLLVQAVELRLERGLALIRQAEVPLEAEHLPVLAVAIMPARRLSEALDAPYLVNKDEAP